MPSTVHRSAPVQTKVEIGRLPSPQNHSVIFVANLLSLFFGNQGGRRELQRKVGTIQSYGGRLAPILSFLFQGQNNLLILSAPPDPSLVGYFQNELGLQLPKFQVAPRQLQWAAMDPHVWKRHHSAVKSLLRQVLDHPASHLDGFVTDDSLLSLAEITGKTTCSTGKGSRQGNDKAALHSFLEEAGLPTLPTLQAHSMAEIESSLVHLHRMGFRRAALKSAIGASGVGMVVVRLPCKGRGLPSHLLHHTPCLVQGWLEPGARGGRMLGSPSVQFYLSEDRLVLYDLTDQILSGKCIHEGNIAPPPWLAEDSPLRASLLHQAEKTGHWLHRQGYRGTGSMDFIAAEIDGTAQAWLCEINARVTGATYPALLARHFRSSGVWQMRNVQLAPQLPGARVLAILRRQRLLFTPQNGRGFLPVNFNQEGEGMIAKCQLLVLAENHAEAEGMWQALSGLQAFSCEYDRD